MRCFELCSKGAGLILEIFAGTWRLSTACRELGLQALSVEKDVKGAESAVAKYDLCDHHHFETLTKLVGVERHRLVHAHFAPSCGTEGPEKGRYLDFRPTNSRDL